MGVDRFFLFFFPSLSSSLSLCASLLGAFRGLMVPFGGRAFVAQNRGESVSPLLRWLRRCSAVYATAANWASLCGRWL